MSDSPPVSPPPGKALVAARSTYGATVTLAVTWLTTHYGLGWDADTCAEISGGLIFLVSALLRADTHTPITGIIRA